MSTSIDWNIDWSVIEKAGIAGIAFVALYLAYKMLDVFLAQWKVSTDAINRNTESFERLTEVIDQAARKEQEFQREATALLYEIRDLSRETNANTHKILLHCEISKTKEDLQTYPKPSTMKN